MDTKPLLLDLFCCQGGASAGYVKAGFEVYGVDISKQARYPYRFMRQHAIEHLTEIVDGVRVKPDAIHASPPCQSHSLAQRIQDRHHNDYIDDTRQLLAKLDVPWVIENVVGAPLRKPIMLCGLTFGLHTYRHRLFESNFEMIQPPHQLHIQPQVKMGRPVREGDFYQAVGNFSGVAYARRDMGVEWMTRDGIRECIPPVYAEWVGEQIMKLI